MTTDAEIIERLATTAPGFLEHYPLTIVLDGFADAVRGWVLDGVADDLLDRCFGAVERLAASGDDRVENAVVVSFLEAAPWGELGVVGRFGPHTRRLVRSANRTLSIRGCSMRPDRAHLTVLEAVPELGSLHGFGEVLGNLGQWAWEEERAGRRGAVLDTLAYVEWLHQQGRPEIAARALSGVFRGVPWGGDVLRAAGPATTAALRKAEWFTGSLPDG